MKNKDRNKAFKKERTKQLKRRTAIQRDTATEINRLLKLAEADILATLKNAPSEWQAWYMPQLKQSINNTMTIFADAGAAKLNSSAGELWQAGLDLIDKPIAAGGINIAAMVPSVDPKQLEAMRYFTTERIKDIGITVANKINTQLGLTMIGSQSVGDAIAQVSSLLDKGGRSRAITLVRTNLGQAYSAAAHQRFQQAKEHLPGLKKQWRKSGKIHSRLAHDAADGQTAEVNEPFIIGGAKLMFPRDPAASAADVINCGCESLPWMDSWDVATPGKKAFTLQEQALDPNKRKLAAAHRFGPMT